jgi:hypothetical protein
MISRMRGQVFRINLLTMAQIAILGELSSKWQVFGMADDKNPVLNSWF